MHLKSEGWSCVGVSLFDKPSVCGTDSQTLALKLTLN